MRKTRKRKGGKILGIGKDGCITDSIECPEYPGFVAKVFHPDKSIDWEIQNQLRKIDFNEDRFIRYHLCDSPLIRQEECPGDFVVFMQRLEPMDTTHLTKKQYRYLKESLNILHDNDIGHGDLPGNVMMGMDGMPRIIDWENSNKEPLTIDIDNVAFFMSGLFKVAK